MGVQWTEEQKKVIELRNRNILVSAAAGSGKTAVLVERIIRILTDADHPVDVDRLLIVTFTEAAAAEMKERIRGAIEKRRTADNNRIRTARNLVLHKLCKLLKMNTAVFMKRCDDRNTGPFKNCHIFSSRYDVILWCAFHF